jgi:NAD(P)-dependent dehydrogenase (short-subunit alcohol dehydrogenase family)
MDRHDLHGNAALITGGSTEIAGAVALALARAGVSICLCGRDASLLDLAAGRVRASGGTCLTIVSELDRPEEVASVVDFVCAGLGALDILVLVSPFWAGGEIHAHSVRTWDLVLDANLREPFLMARAVLPLFRTHKQGQILAIGSDSALGIYKQDGAYGVAMHALTALMELIRLENEELGIRTHILAPGVALTTETDSEGRPALTAAHVADWAVWQLTRPGHLRGSGPVRIQPR